MTDGILKALRKENCPEKIIIEVYIEKQLEKLLITLVKKVREKFSNPNNL